MNNSIFVSGFFSDNDKMQLNECCLELEKHSISLQVRNLNGTIMHSAFDFADVEVIAFSYELAKALYYSGCYDFLKYMILKLWHMVRRDTPNRVPFTIDIEGVPTINGPENLKFKISGSLSEDEKMLALEKSFELASQIEKHQAELLEKSLYNDAFNAHVFAFNQQDSFYTEIDIAKEVQKKIAERKTGIANSSDTEQV